MTIIIKKMLNFLYTNPTITIDLPGDKELMNNIKSFAPPLPAYDRNDTLVGHVTISPPNGRVVSHRAINIVLFGEFRTDKNKMLSRFFQKTQCLMAPGDLSKEIDVDFAFQNMNLPTNTYYGTTINIVFGIEARVVHRISDFVVEQQFIALTYDRYPLKTVIHNEIGMKNILHIEFVFPKQAYDAREVVIGKAFFILVKLRIVEIKMLLYQNEEYDFEGTRIFQKTILRTYEILDGSPVRGDDIPIRIFMGDANIWPYVNFQNSPLKVEQFLRIEMVDENGKSYFKRMRVYFKRFEPVSTNTDETT